MGLLARLITLRFEQLLDGFDDTPLRDFLKDKEVFAIRDHFFVRNEMPYVAVVVTYGLPSAPAAAQGGESIPRQRRKSALQVPREHIPLFNALRDWRAERSKREGVPPYLVCTNKQLAAMVEARPRSLGKLGAIKGIGKAKLEKYGEELLALLARESQDRLVSADQRGEHAGKVAGTVAAETRLSGREAKSPDACRPGR